MQQHQTLSDAIWDKVDTVLDFLEQMLPLYIWMLAALALIGVSAFVCIVTLLVEVVTG